MADAESFLKCVERDLFSDTSQKKIRSNLTQEENSTLKFCREEVLFNPNSADVIRLQDKGNKFVVVDKPTDIQKTQQQISRSSMVRVDEDPTQTMIDKVENWCEKWNSEGHLSEAWASFIVNKDAKAAKNCPLYKTHKSDIPVRVLTSGCNSATESSHFMPKKNVKH